MDGQSGHRDTRVFITVRAETLSAVDAAAVAALKNYRSGDTAIMRDVVDRTGGAGRIVLSLNHQFWSRILVA